MNNSDNAFNFHGILGIIDDYHQIYLVMRSVLNFLNLSEKNRKSLRSYINSNAMSMIRIDSPSNMFSSIPSRFKRLSSFQYSSLIFGIKIWLRKHHMSNMLKVNSVRRFWNLYDLFIGTNKFLNFIYSNRSDMKLNIKQKRFCKYYLMYGNQTKAYEIAYNSSYDVAITSASRLIHKPVIREYLQKLAKKNHSNTFDFIQKHTGLDSKLINKFIKKNGFIKTITNKIIDPQAIVALKRLGIWK